MAAHDNRDDKNNKTFNHMRGWNDSDFCSLRSKRFQSSYSAKVRGEEETLANKPHDSGKRPLIFHGSVHL